jgi:phage terminase small subunit
LNEKGLEMKPPKHLRPATRRWFAEIADRFALESHHFRLLLLASEAWDECVAAGEALAEHGTTFEDRFGSPRARPEVAIRRDARIAFARLVKQLGVDDAEIPTTPGFHPGRANSRRK